MSKHGLIIVAAGSGERMGLSTPKVLIPLHGISLLSHTIRSFQSWPIFSETVVMVSREIFQRVSEILPQGWRCLVGGESRQESMGFGLDGLSCDCEYVWIHDGARPFVSKDLLERLQKTVEAGHNCIAALPASDTIKKVNGEKIVGTLDRCELFLAQTPQVFSASVLREAVALARKEGWTVTDEASMVERVGGQVRIVLGETTNIKITTQNDLMLGEFLASERERQK